MAKIFDPVIELQILESQPEWIDINSRIETLKNDLIVLNKRLDRDPMEWVAKRISKIENEIKFFENIILFWATNYNKLKKVSEAFEKQAKIYNCGADLADLIEDLRMMLKYERDENLLLMETFVKLASNKGLDSDKFNSAMSKLRDKTKQYIDYVNTKIEEIINE
jgi:hypothetical protein